MNRENATPIEAAIHQALIDGPKTQSEIVQHLPWSADYVRRHLYAMAKRGELQRRSLPASRCEYARNDP